MSYVNPEPSRKEAGLAVSSMVSLPAAALIRTSVMWFRSLVRWETVHHEKKMNPPARFVKQTSAAVCRFASLIIPARFHFSFGSPWEHLSCPPLVCSMYRAVCHLQPNVINRLPAAASSGVCTELDIPIILVFMLLLLHTLKPLKIRRLEKVGCKNMNPFLVRVH